MAGSSTATKEPAKFQNETSILIPDLVPSNFVRSYDKMSYAILNQSPGDAYIHVSLNRAILTWVMTCCLFSTNSLRDSGDLLVRSSRTHLMILRENQLSLLLLAISM